MSVIKTCSAFFAACCGRNLLIYDFKSCKELILLCSRNETDSSTSSSENQLVCVTISQDESLVAVASSNKSVYIWDTETWSLKVTCNAGKRPMSLTFTPDASSLLVADKAGDVYSFSVNESTSPSPSNDVEKSQWDEHNEELPGPEPILGHLSMILDIAVSTCGKYLVTCDRDEKIRVSCYPDTYNIHAYLLGHQEFVNQVAFLPHDARCVISSSGDGSIRLWDVINGSCEYTVDVTQDNPICPIQPPDFPKNNEENGTQENQEIETSENQEIETSENLLLEKSNNTSDNDVINDVIISDTSSTITAICHIALRLLDTDSSLLAVTLHRCPCILLYKIVKRKAQFLHCLSLKEVPLQLCWLPSGELLILSSQPETNAGIFKYDNNKLVQIPSHPLVQFIANQHQLLALTVNLQKQDINGLFKQRYDNMADYLKKKQARLEENHLTKTGR